MPPKIALAEPNPAELNGLKCGFGPRRGATLHATSGRWVLPHAVLLGAARESSGRRQAD
jgi:hypothetical protein